MKATQGYYVFLAAASFSASSISRHQTWVWFKARCQEDLTSVDFGQAQGYFCVAKATLGKDTEAGSR